MVEPSASKVRCDGVRISGEFSETRGNPAGNELARFQLFCQNPFRIRRLRVSSPWGTRDARSTKGLCKKSLPQLLDAANRDKIASYSFVRRPKST